MLQQLNLQESQLLSSSKKGAVRQDRFGKVSPKDARSHSSTSSKGVLLLHLQCLQQLGWPIPGLKSGDLPNILTKVGEQYAWHCWMLYLALLQLAFVNTVLFDLNSVVKR